MIHFHALTVAEVRKETDDCVSILFDVPTDLKDTFRFVQGQSITVRWFKNGEEVRRNYSICSSPLEEELRIAVKRVDGGLFSTYANEQLKAGDKLELLPPTGKFHVALDPKQEKNYAAFVAGSGITPVLSIIKTTLFTEPKSSFTLVYGNRTRNSIIFKEELEELKDRFMTRFRIFHVLSREVTDAPINHGRIDREKLIEFFGKLIRLPLVHEFFLCGPDQMIFCIKNYLEEQGVPSRQVHFELFTIPGEKKSTVEHKVSASGPKGPQSHVSIKLDGILFDFELGYEDESILDAALQQGADLPYACKGGVCTTCRAKLVEGKVSMDVNWGLEPEELEKGFILTCQSHPRTEKVVVDFDGK